MWGVKYELEEEGEEWLDIPSILSPLICVLDVGFEDLNSRTLSSANTSSLSIH